MEIWYNKMLRIFLVSWFFQENRKEEEKEYFINQMW